MITADKFPDLSLWLTSAVESAFGIIGRNDVAVDVFGVLFTRNEAPIQIEVPYSAGTDEYKTGEIFDPSEEVREAVVIKIRANFAAFLKKHDIAPIVPSVWILPQYKSTFKVGEVED